MEDLVHLSLIWGGVLIAAWLAERTQLTPVLYFLAFGAVMVNIGWLPEQSTPFIQGFSEIGIILIMFALGFEENSSKFVQSIKRAWGIALFGAIAPFLTAYYSAIVFWGDYHVAIMCGLAMTATAVSLTMVSLRSEKLHTTAAATGIMTSAVLDDIGSLVMVAILVPVATGGETLTLVDVETIVVKAALFFAIVTAVGLWVLPHDTNRGFLRHIPFIRSYGIRHALSFSRGEKMTLIILLIALLMSLVAFHFGFHPAVGAYMAGLILKDEYFHIDSRSEGSRYQDTKRIIDDVAFTWIGPVFFVELGTKLVFDSDIFFSVIEETAILTTGLFLAQILSAGLAARWTAGFSWPESVMIGFGMLGRAELAFVVMDIGYVQNSILTHEAFYTLMSTAFFLNVAVPVTIRLWKPYFTGERRLRWLGGG